MRTVTVEKKGDITKTIIVTDSVEEALYGGEMVRNTGDNITISYNTHPLKKEVLSFAFDEFTDTFGTANAEDLADYLATNNFFVKPSGNGGGTDFLIDNAKSVIFDIADNHGHAGYMGVRSIEFTLNGSVLPLTATDYTAYATSQLAGDQRTPTMAFDTTLSKVGGTANTSWASEETVGVTNQRLIIIFNEVPTFDGITVNNYHTGSGTGSNIGINNTKIYTSPNEVVDVTYGAAIPSSTFIFNDSIRAHVAANVIDNTPLALSPSETLLLTPLSDDQLNHLNPQAGLVVYSEASKELRVGNGERFENLKKAHVGTGTLDTMIITDSTTNPSYITGFVNTGANVGIELTDSATGTFQNTMGRTIISAAGTISFHPTETGGGVGIMYLLSERSTDGITWTVNSLSLRRIEVPSNGESFATKVSSISNLLDGEYFRFRMYEAGSGGVTLISETQTVMGQSVTMPSATFILTEQ